MENADLKRLLLLQLADMNAAEKLWIAALPGFAQAAHDTRLRQTLEAEIHRAGEDSGRLQEIARMLDAPGRPGDARGMAGLLGEAQHSLERSRELGPEAADTALIVALMKVKYYEISAYRSARGLAEHIGETEVARQLQVTENRENDFDSWLAETLPMAA